MKFTSSCTTHHFTVSDAAVIDRHMRNNLQTHLMSYAKSESGHLHHKKAAQRTTLPQKIAALKANPGGRRWLSKT